MNKLEEDNKIELEESLEEENLDLEETYKEKALRLVKKPIFYISAFIVFFVMSFIIGNKCIFGKKKVSAGSLPETRTTSNPLNFNFLNK